MGVYFCLMGGRLASYELKKKKKKKKFFKKENILIAVNLLLVFVIDFLFIYILGHFQGENF